MYCVCLNFFFIIDSPDACEIRSVIHFLPATNNIDCSDIHRQIMSINELWRLKVAVKTKKNIQEEEER